YVGFSIHRALLRAMMSGVWRTMISLLRSLSTISCPLHAMTTRLCSMDSTHPRKTVLTADRTSPTAVLTTIEVREFHAEPRAESESLHAHGDSTSAESGCKSSQPCMSGKAYPIRGHLLDLAARN